jgi:hypothetical protein
VNPHQNYQETGEQGEGERLDTFRVRLPGSGRRLPQEAFMGQQILRQRMRMAAIAIATVLMLSGLALAQRGWEHDDDDGYRDGYASQARQQGYQRGYNDGIEKGRHEGRENDPFDYRTPDWRQASRGYQDWMGPRNVYQRGYQEGYQNGFRSGFESIQGRRGDRDGYGSGSYGGGGGYQSPAFDSGYRDGATVAREDMEHGKRFNSNPRGRYDDMDHGYRREYGDKHTYKAAYADGYRQGYEANYRGYRY